MIDFIRRVAARYPDRRAVSDSEKTLTYGELWEQALLTSRKFPSGDAGYLLLQEKRSCALLIRLLAVWLAGHAPLMLDPKTPGGRMNELEGLVRPCDVFARDFRSSAGVEYLVTTSGSSGRPKIVRIGRGSLERVIRAQRDAFRIDRQARVGWILSPGFDASLSDIFTALCSGAELVCGRGLHPECLGEITHLDIPPALLEVYRPNEMPKSLRTVVVGGAPSRPEVLREWAEHFRLVSVYGPSETTICSSLSVVDRDWDRPYIGKPLPGVRYRVEGGELLIGGPTVALGYLGDEPGFERLADERWYRTGDLVGQDHPLHGFEFFGRKDRQVQLRGIRFEPEEVEQRAARALERETACEIVYEQICIAWETSGNPCEEERRLRGALEDGLPRSMQPSHYLALTKLPRTTSGKVDRSALQEKLSSLKREMTSLQQISLETSVPRNLECRPCSPKAKVSGSVESLLVTGLTGSLGSALRPHLEERYRLVSVERTVQSEYGLTGDLKRDRFGWTEERWKEVMENCDAVLHLAAEVDLLRSYDELRAVNTEPLRRLIEAGKPLVLASTLAIPLCSDKDGRLHGGYQQSKASAEALVENTAGTTLRYGYLFDRPKRGDLLTGIVTRLAQLGVCPVSEDPQLVFDWTPMKWAVARTLEAISMLRTERTVSDIRRGWHFHLNDLATAMENAGLVRCVSMGEFAKVLDSFEERSIYDCALWKCLPRSWARNRGLDLFLLGNSEELMESSIRGPQTSLQNFVDCMKESAVGRARTPS